MIKNGGSGMKAGLLNICNRSLAQGVLPKQWKSSLVHAIPKPKKDHSLPTGYRPISLLSIASKVMEHIILARLYPVAIQDNWISPLQSGFKEFHSTYDHMLRLSMDINIAHTEKQTTSLLLLDIEKAYDRVSRKRLVCILHQKGLRGPILKWLTDFLFDRTQRVVVDGHQSTLGSSEEGLPQGAILSPFLFILAFDGIVDGVRSNATCFSLWW